MAIAIFCNEVKGKSMLAISRDLGVQYKTSFVLAHKMREAMASELRGVSVGGEGRKGEIDGGYFGGYVKPANRIENRRDRRLRQKQSGKRKVVVVIRERDGKTLPGVFASEVAALNFVRTRIARGTTVYADEAGAWNELHGRFTIHRINHQEAYSLDGDIYTNNAESFFSRIAPGRNRASAPRSWSLSRSVRTKESAWRGATTTERRLTESWRSRCGTSRA
jgi:hypothetical protein